MIRDTNMFQALLEHYPTLVQNRVLPPFGYSRRKITFVIVLNKNGTIHDIEEYPKDNIPLMDVPGTGSRSSGYKPFLLWDNADYLLGFPPGRSSGKFTNAGRFAASQKLHLDTKINDPDYAVLQRFFASWNMQAPTFNVAGKLLDAKKNVKTGFCVFRVVGQTNFIHDSPGVVAAMYQILVNDLSLRNLDGKRKVMDHCLLTGRYTQIARLHEPKIPLGASGTGIGLSNFYAECARSHGFKFNFNAPVGIEESVKYNTVLKYFIEDDSHSCNLMNSKIVFWADTSGSINKLVQAFVSGDVFVNGARVKIADQFRDNLLAVAKGECPSDLGVPDAAFHIGSILPGTGRGSIEYFHTMTIGETADHIGAFYRDLQIVGRRDFEPEFPSAYDIARSLEQVADPEPGSARRVLTDGTKRKIANTANAIIEAVLDNTTYPPYVYDAVLARVRRRRAVKYLHAAIIKAVLVRNYREDITMTLNVDNPSPAYHCGRLFATFEKIQEDALPRIKSKLGERCFTQVMETPAYILPQLVLKSKKAHQGLLPESSRKFYDKLIQEIHDKIGGGYPPILYAKDHGLFISGYYQQRQEFFRKKNNGKAPEQPAPTDEPQD